MAQLEALGRFLEEKKQDILEATASDMGKVRGVGNELLSDLSRQQGASPVGTNSVYSHFFPSWCALQPHDLVTQC